MINEFKKANVEIRGCKKTKRIVKGIKLATEQDWYTEYLDLILSVKIVSSIIPVDVELKHHKDDRQLVQ